jgi:hypothetical protein
VLALAVISMHLFANVLSLLTGWVITDNWVEGVISIIDFFYSFCVLYFLWRYSTRPRLQPKVEEPYPSVVTEEIVEEEIE